MYWLAIPFALLLFGGTSFNVFWNAADRSWEISVQAGAEEADVTTSEGAAPIPPH
jgi:hypothetical protein